MTFREQGAAAETAKSAVFVLITRVKQKLVTFKLFLLFLIKEIIFWVGLDVNMLKYIRIKSERDILNEMMIVESSMKW